MFPCLKINLRNIQENGRKIVDFCRKRGIETVGVTKGVCADLNIVKAMLEGGIELLGDSRIQNIIKLNLFHVILPEDSLLLATYNLSILLYSFCSKQLMK